MSNDRLIDIPSRLPPDAFAPQAIKVRSDDADRVYKALANHIRFVERGLKNDEAVSFRYASFGGSLNVQLHTVGCVDGVLIMLMGTTQDGQEVQIVQHPSQINVLLLTMKRAEPEEPRKPIGFLN